jgi:hypothetical protein
LWFFEGLIEVLEVRYEWSFCSWAVRSKPVATGMSHSYLDPNRGSLQKPIGGRSVLPLFHAISMLKTTDANAPAETHAVSIYKGAIEKNRNRQQKTKQLKSTKNSKRVVGLWGLEII